MKYRMTHRNNTAGVALAELICSVFILTVGMGGVIQMYHLGLQKTAALAEYAVALEALQNELETLRSQPFDSLTPGIGQSFTSDPESWKTLTKVRGIVTIKSVSESSVPLKEITVRIRWTGEHGRRITKSLTTLVSPASNR